MKKKVIEKKKSVHIILTFFKAKDKTFTFRQVETLEIIIIKNKLLKYIFGSALFWESTNWKLLKKLKFINIYIKKQTSLNEHL